MNKQMLGVICLCPIGNAQGRYKFMSLATRKMIRRFAWTPIPMTQEVIDRVLHLGKKENVPSGVIICNLHGNVEVNDFETDDIEGVYGYDIQQILYPNIQNENEDDNQTNQNEEDAHDVTDSDSNSESDSKES